jgi:hypothetical protein
MPRYRFLFVLLAVLALAGCAAQSTTAPVQNHPELVGDAVTGKRVPRPASVPELARLYLELCTSYQGGTWPPAKLSRFTWAIRNAAPSILLDKCDQPGKREDAGKFGGVSCVVYVTGCGSLYFEFHDELGAYMLGPGGWAVFVPGGAAVLMAPVPVAQ